MHCVYLLTAVVCWIWSCCCHAKRTGSLDPYQAFLNVINLQLNADAFCKESFITGLFW